MAARRKLSEATLLQSNMHTSFFFTRGKSPSNGQDDVQQKPDLFSFQKTRLEITALVFSSSWGKRNSRPTTVGDAAEGSWRRAWGCGTAVVGQNVVRSRGDKLIGTTQSGSEMHASLFLALFVDPRGGYQAPANTTDTYGTILQQRAEI